MLAGGQPPKRRLRVKTRVAEESAAAPARSSEAIGDVECASSIKALRPHAPWLRDELRGDVGHATLRKRLLAVRQARVGEGLIKKWIKAERASRCQTRLMAAAEVPPSGRARELGDVDALGPFASELREHTRGSGNHAAVEKTFAAKYLEMR